MKFNGIPLRVTVIVALSVLTLSLTAADDKAFAARQAEVKKSFKQEVGPFVEKYCASCHGKKRRKANLNFVSAQADPGSAKYRRHWKRALASVSAHDMPPESRKQPTEEERAKFKEWIGKIKFLSPKDPGLFVIRRLTKVEYGNTLRELFGVDPSIADELPDEVAGEGYLNSLSPLQSEQFLGIANEVLKQIPSTVFGEASAKQFARSQARRAYRRPPTEAEVEVLLEVFKLGREHKLSHQDSLRLMLKAILVSPQFLFITPAKNLASDQTIVPLDDYQLASRLSYLLWSTIPDAELSALADKGKLRDPKVLKAQALRLLKDKRSRALFDGFGAQWLGLDKLARKTFDTAKFPQMTPAMRAAMYDETRLFFGSIVRDNRSVVSFIDSDYTFLNGTLARIYGLEKTVTGPNMRKVRLSNPNRGGILGMPGILATTSFPNRTSPVNRGVWVLEQVLGEHIPPAPADVPELEKQDQKKVENLTLRQRTELHVSNPTCANCHKVLDPIGFGLENFDAIGRWRTQDDSGGAIDAAGELPGGKRFTSPKELKAIIAARKDDLAHNLTAKLLAYALGRQLEGYDEIVVDQLMETIAKDDYRMQTMVTEIVTSYPFMQRRVNRSE
ncbi:MAG: DUF1592 domain-containing protein [Limisphaerales bacterium]